MTDQLQLRHWQQIKQTQALEYAGAPEGNAALVESRRYGLAADRIEELVAEREFDQRNAAASQRESAMLLDKCEALAARFEAMREALKFYADGDHFIVADEDAWDTVSGEPQNLWEDESNTATVEDGSIAKHALALPNTAATILRQRDARTLRNAAVKFMYGVRFELEHMADELEKQHG